MNKLQLGIKQYENVLVVKLNKKSELKKFEGFLEFLSDLKNPITKVSLKEALKCLTDLPYIALVYKSTKFANEQKAAIVLAVKNVNKNEDLDNDGLEIIE